MPSVYKRKRDGKPVGSWLAKVRDDAGRWRTITLGEARTKADAERLAGDMAMRQRRAREGLEPLPDRSLTIGKLLRWWIDTYRAGTPGERQERDRFRRYFERSELACLPAVALTAGRLELFLQAKAKGQGGTLGPASLNKLRAMVRTAWNKGRKAGLLAGPNPAADVDPRKVPKRAPSILTAEEVGRLLPELGEADALMVAMMALSGLRKGELFGLRKADVDLPRGLLTVRRSYDRETTKASREETVPIGQKLVPYLEAAMDGFPGPLLFPKADGSMRTEGDALLERFRRALGRAGIVTGYRYLCRWCKAEGRPYKEEHVDNKRRPCPQCGKALWVVALPKRIRVHDLRHTFASLLLGAHADLFAVAKLMRHADASVTAKVYAHLQHGYLRAAIDSLPALGAPSGNISPAAQLGAPVVHDPPNQIESAQGELPERPDSRGVAKARLAGVEPAARGFEGRVRRSQGVARIRKSSQLLTVTATRVPASRRVSHRLPRILRTGCGRC